MFFFCCFFWFKISILMSTCVDQVVSLALGETCPTGILIRTISLWREHTNQSAGFQNQDFGLVFVYSVQICIQWLIQYILAIWLG